MTIPNIVYIPNVRPENDETDHVSFTSRLGEETSEGRRAIMFLPRARPSSCRDLLLQNSKQDSSSSLLSPPPLPRRMESGYQARRDVNEEEDDQDVILATTGTGRTGRGGPIMHPELRPDFKRGESNRSSLTDAPRMPQRKDSTKSRSLRTELI